ncbi:MAG TPA: segregation/condensation protein A [Candidatus Paceibacterota bacterium]
MSQTYELKTKYFVGPIQKLLELIVEKKLDINEMSMAEVTADFLAYLSMLRDISPALLADFILVASRLMFIKSKSLLPEFAFSEEEEKDAHDLELHLVLYKECQSAAKKIREFWRLERFEYGRELFREYQLGFFYPSPSLDIHSINESLKTLLTAIETLQLREKSITRSVLISVEQKMKDLLSELTNGRHSRFSTLAKNKDEMIALFLAVLHLLKDRIVDIEQKTAFSDIIIKERDAI